MQQLPTRALASVEVLQVEAHGLVLAEVVALQGHEEDAERCNVEHVEEDVEYDSQHFNWPAEDRRCYQLPAVCTSEHQINLP